MKRVLLFALQAAILVATMNTLHISGVAFSVAVLVTLFVIFSAKTPGKGTHVGVVGDKWQVKYAPDKDTHLTATFHPFSGVVTVDDEWSALPKAQQDAVLAHEAGHGNDRLLVPFRTVTLFLSLAAQTAVVFFILRSGFWTTVLTLGITFGACVLFSVVLALVLGTKKASAAARVLSGNVVLCLTAAFVCGREILIAGALLCLAKWVGRALSRQGEFVADRFAKKAGYGVPLVEVLSSAAHPANAFEEFFSTHPTLKKRVAALTS